MSVFVYQNNTQLFAANGNDANGSDGNTSILSQADGTFNVNTTLSVNDTIDFMVFSNGDRSADETAIRGTITTAIPEPSSCLLGFAGIACLASRRRRCR